MAGNTLQHYSLIKQPFTATGANGLLLGAPATGFFGYEDYKPGGGRVSYFLTAGSEWEYGVGEMYATGAYYKIDRNCIVDASTTGGLLLSTGATGQLTDSPLPKMHGWIGLKSFGDVPLTATGGSQSLLNGASFSMQYQSDGIPFATGNAIDIPCWCSHISYDVRCSWVGTATGDIDINGVAVPISLGRFSLHDHYSVWNGDPDGYDFEVFSVEAFITSTGSLTVSSVASVEFHF